MIYAIVKKELKEIFRERLLQVAGVSLLVLLGLSLAISYSYNRMLDSQLEAANETARQHWEAQGNKNQHSAAHYGIYLFKPKSVLAFWDHGIDKYVGSTIYTEAHKRNHPHFKPVEDSPMLAKWGELTPGFILLYLLPLLLIWLCAGAVSGERERQTLTIVLSQGVSWRQLLIAKAISRWVVGLLLVLPAFAGMALLLSQIDNTIQGSMVTWGALLLTYLLYIGIFIHAGIAISARASSTTASTMALLGLWLISVWVLPRLGASLAEKLYPAPSETSFDTAIAAAIDQEGIKRHDPTNPRTIEFTQKTLAEYGVDSVEALPVNFNGLILQAAEERNDVIFDKHHQALDKRYRQQTKVIQALGILSPFIPARHLSMGLCQTDLRAAVDFQEQADRYRKRFIKALNKDLIESGPVKPQRFVQDRSFWKKLPSFSYDLPGIGFAIRHHWQNVITLLLWFALSIGVLYFSKPKTY